MKPEISAAGFGSITTGGDTYRHDVVIKLNGEVGKIKKKLSRAIFGTSHIVALEEAKKVYDENATQLIVGTGQRDFFEENKCSVQMTTTPEAIKIRNAAWKKAVGLFHVTC